MTWLVAAKIWHMPCCCGIEKQAPWAGRSLDSLLVSQLFISRRFLHAQFSCSCIHACRGHRCDAGHLVHWRLCAAADGAARRTRMPRGRRHRLHCRLRDQSRLRAARRRHAGVPLRRPALRSGPPKPPLGEGGCEERIKKIHDAAQRHVLACQIAGTGGALTADPIEGRAPTREGGEWDKTSEVPAVHGALRWWAHSKAVKPHFSKRYWRAPARSRAPAVSMPVLPSATPAPRPATTR